MGTRGQARSDWVASSTTLSCARCDLVREHPEIGVAVDGPHPHRQFLVDGFPYKVIYRERADDLYIVAFAHTSRRPEYWKQRR